jgi:hypothetical protein
MDGEQINTVIITHSDSTFHEMSQELSAVLLHNIVPGWRYLLGYNRLSHLIFHILFPDHRWCYNRSITNSHYKTFLNGD